MDLPSTLNAPRFCQLAGRTYFVRSISLEGLAIVLNWLDDVLPGRAERKMPPKISDEASQAALQSPTGETLMAWIALRENGLSFDDVSKLIKQSAAASTWDIERLRLIDVLFGHRRTSTPTDGKSDLSETWCSKGMANLVESIGYREALALSLDQFEWLMSGGELDENPAYSSEALTERQRKWREEELPLILRLQAEQGASA